MRPDHVWASNITYIPLKHGVLNLTAVMDLYSRNVLSWQLSNTLTGDVCVQARDAALSRARPETFNTDHGAQFMARKPIRGRARPLELVSRATAY